MAPLMRKLWATFNASETLRTSGSAGLIVSARVIGTLGTLVYTVLMARMMTPQDFGIAWSLWSAVFIAAYLSTLNIGATAIREVAHARSTGDDAAAAGFIKVSRKMLFAATLPAIAGFVALIWWQNPAMMSNHSIAVWLAAATIPVMGWNATNAAQATALGQVLRSQIPGMLLRPLVFVATLGAIWLSGLTLGLETVIAIYLCVALLISAVQYVMVRQFFSFTKSVRPDVSSWRRWIAAGLLLAPNRLLTDRLKDVLLLLSAVPLGAVGIAKMAVALSIINFLNFAINAVETAFAPKTAQNLTRNLADGVSPREMKRAIHFIAITGVLKMAMVGAGAVALLLFLPLLIRLYGPEYSDSAAVVWWFVLIPLANAFFGNTSLVMQVFDQRAEFFLTSICALLALVLAGIYGVPLLVARGADPLIATSVAFVFTMVGLQAVRWMLCLLRTGIDVSFPGALIRRQQQLRTSLARRG